MAAVVMSCNNDIFIESDNLPNITDVTIEGDGGQWSTPYPRKGLKKISLGLSDASSFNMPYVAYIGKNGKELDSDCSPSELESINCETPNLHFEICFDGDMIYVTSHYNAWYEQDVTLSLEYDHGVTKYINITIMEGARLELINAYATGDFILEEDVEKSTHTVSLTNNGHITQKLEIMPYLDARCSDEVYPKDYSKDFWINGFKADLPMLSYNGRDWYWRDYEDIRVGERRTFSPSAYGITDKIVIDVPPYAKAKVTYTLHYSRATEDGIMFLYNTVTDYKFVVDMTWTSKYATSYEYEVEIEE